MKHKPKPSSDALLNVAASEQDANMLYATRFFAPDPFIFFQHRGKRFVVMSDLELDRARRQAAVDSVLSLTQIEEELKQRKQRLINTAAVLRHLFAQKGIRAVLVPSSFPLGLADQLRRRGVKVIASPSPLFPERELKSAGEIREIIKAQRAAEAGVQAAIAMIREARVSASRILYSGSAKLTSERVKECIATAVLRHGCVAGHTIVACGQQGCDPHDQGSGPLRASQPIILDVFPRSQSSGYWGDITRTVVKGRASEWVHRAYQAVLSAQLLALRQIKADVLSDTIHLSVQEEFQRRGFATGSQGGRMQGFFHGTGHGVGLEIHELPRLSLRAPTPLKAGQVVTVEPGLYYAKMGGVRIEDLVVVTTTGNRNLTRLPKFLEM